MTAIGIGADYDGRGAGRTARIGTITIVTGALARMRRSGIHGLAVGLGIFTASLALQAAGKAGVHTPPAGGITLAQVALMIVTALVAGLGAAVAMRLFVMGPKGLLRVDRRLLQCGGIIGGLTLFFSVGQMAFGLATRGLSQGAVAIASLAFMVAYLAGVFAMLRITLWPICRLTGRDDVGLRQAWRLMRKTTRGLLLGYLIFMVPFGVVIAGNWPTLIAGGEREMGVGMQALFQAVGTAYGLCCYAMSATIYALRVENPATVADVFD